ncbi:catechol 2,3-dioxygenase-like lactoylglutathione lyase family enzyme [Nocardia kruczakiae]|uniref:Catechol 2,3-dioxygenase-like lactoylglutathione lyase family enzyme n=1 Tax=Nocardia kruczakiae TaxID=261477 RepID=A0ABU1X9F7_9NOCA|nr:VOC family protein [Nocardia kruczakiae]MDR7166721.1 catechol 2,3-dioxygenase-like lactoylglutathione lyase family enzyme [Nocardia kruczakiae]
MTDHSHAGLHSDAGARPGEHPGRACNPIVKVLDLAWLRFEKPDLERAETFAHAFGFSTAARTAEELWLRGVDAGPPCVLIRRGCRSRFVGPAFRADGAADLLRLAEAVGSRVEPLPDRLGGQRVGLTDPSGLQVDVVADTTVSTALTGQPGRAFNFGHPVQRINRAQRPIREPARVQRLGHVVVQTTRYRTTLDWYLRHLGMIVSDFLYYPGQRDRGPVLSFLRCDRGSEPADHHTLALTLGPSNRYVHSAYQVTDLDALAAGGEYLRDHGYRRSWGIGRHIQGSQIFDYWRDPDGFLVEHFSDGDMFDNTLEPGWAPMTASGLAQWGPPASRDFLGTAPGRDAVRELRAIAAALRADNEFDLHRLRGLLKVANS